MENCINVIGAGLAGSEAAYQIAKRGVKVKLYEMRPHKDAKAHHTNKFAELVCSNSLKSNNLDNNRIDYYSRILKRVSNRDNISQFFNRFPDSKEQYYLGRQELSNQDFLGLVIDYKDGIATIEQRNNFKVGDVVQFFGPNTETFEYEIKEISIY